MASRETTRVTTRTMSLWSRPAAVWNNRKVLWLLVRRDLSVRYANSALGYIWSVLDPLLMSAVYWFVFTRIFNQRGIGHDPYVIFLIVALLPWTWFSNGVIDSSHALQSESRLVRSTSLPRELWAIRVVLSKGTEFLFSIPVLILLIIIFSRQIEINSYLWLFPVAMIMQVTLMVGMALLLAPATVLLRDVDPLIKIAMRFLFYVSPIIYGVNDIMAMQTPEWMKQLFLLNPVTGIMSTYRAGFFLDELNWRVILTAAIASVVVLIAGQLVFSRLERDVLKEM